MPAVDRSREEKLPPFPDDVPTAPLVTISLSKLLHGDEDDEHAQLYQAAKSLGFFYLDMRGCPVGESILRQADAMFDLAEDFFALPEEEKRKYDFAAQGKYFGYKGMGKEVIDGEGTRDRNEIYNISKDDILSISEPLPAPELINNRRSDLSTYIHTNYTILDVLFTSLSRSLRLEPSTLSNLHRLHAPSGCHVRFIRAPPSTKPVSEETAALGEHTDFGSLTILFNRLGGLQVQLPQSQDWVYVRPVPGCAIVNLGDAMVKFSAGILRSNLHRVVTPPGEQAKHTRYSLVYFSRPEHEVVMKRLPGGLIDEQGVTSPDGETEEKTRDWMLRRHLGRKIEYFTGPESWQNAMGTEKRDVVVQ